MLEKKTTVSGAKSAKRKTPRTKETKETNEVQEMDAVENHPDSDFVSDELLKAEASPPDLDAEEVLIERFEPSRRKIGPIDEYTFVAHWDRDSSQFVATCLEVPSVRGSGHTRELAEEDLVDGLVTFLDGCTERGESLPPSLQSRKYPENLSVPISQALYRKIDLLSHAEKMPIERLVVEMLSSGLERRYSHSSRQEFKKSPHQGHGHHDNRRHGDNRGQHRHRSDNRSQDRGHHRTMDHRDGNRAPQREGNQGGRGRYNQTMQRNENFMEYVRNLEKKGGGGGGWRK